mgnify:CR=1 FL=1
MEQGKSYRDLITIDRSDIHNRKIIAKTDIKEGSLIYSTDPIEFAIHHQFRPKFCNHCLKFNNETIPCPGCGEVFYCKGECTQADLPKHSEECKIIKEVKEKHKIEITIEVLLSIRCLRSNSNKLDELYYNSLQITKEDEVLAKNTANALSEFFPKTKKKAIEKLVGKLLLNTYSFSLNDEAIKYALGLYYPSNFLNHSCSPNAIFIYRGPKQFVYALSDIKDGQEIVVSYGEYAKPYFARINFLEKACLFQGGCDCPKCKNGLTSIRCQKCEKGEIAFLKRKFICGSCQSTYTHQEMQKLNSAIIARKEEVNKKTEEQEKLQALNELKKLVVDNNYYLALALEAMIKFYSGKENFEEAYKYSKDLLAKMFFLYKPIDPMLGNQFIELGDVAIKANKAEEGKTYIQKGVKILGFTSSESVIEGLKTKYKDIL